MTDRQEIFRSEALEHRQRLEAPGSLVDIGPRWTSGAFWFLLILVAAGIFSATQIQIERYASGPTAIGADGRVVVLIPSTLAPEVAPGRRVDIGDATARVEPTGQEILDPFEVKDRYGIEVAVSSIPVVTSATAGAGSSGTARVLVESENMLVALVPGLKVLFGDNDG